MEFQEGVMRLMIQKPSDKQQRKPEKKKKKSDAESDAPKSFRPWKIFNKLQSKIESMAVTKTNPNPNLNPNPNPPSEFLCPITGSLMAEPVIVSSGHTFERACAEACKALLLTPTLADSSMPDFSSLIPNLALRSTIAAWCRDASVTPPTPLDTLSAAKLVRGFMAKKDSVAPPAPLDTAKLVRGFTARKDCSTSTEFSFGRASSSSSSGESVELTKPVSEPSPLLEQIEKPVFVSEEENLLAKLRSQQVFEAEEGLISLREMSRTKEDARARLCSYRILAALRSLISSRYTGIQVNSVAVLVNLSLEKSNKKKIIRSGIVPLLIDVLKGGSLEAQEHAAGVIFSLAVEDDNRAAIGVLGALQPLIHLLRSESEQTRRDAVLALYHLSLVQTNQSKLVKMGSVPVLLNMAKSGNLTSRILSVLGNLCSGLDGRVAMLDSGAVECMVAMLKRGSSEVSEGCVTVLYMLSHSGMRFRALANDAKLEEALKTAEEAAWPVWSGRTRDKARAVVEATKQKRESNAVNEDVNWEELLGDVLERGSRSSIFGSGL